MKINEMEDEVVDKQLSSKFL